MVKLTVEDVSVEMTQAIIRAQPKPSDEAVGGQGPRFACVSGGFQSFTVAAMHVVHPRQVLSLDVNLKGLWARGVTKQTIGALTWGLHVSALWGSFTLTPISMLTFLLPAQPNRRGRSGLCAAGRGGHGDGHRLGAAGCPSCLGVLCHPGNAHASRGSVSHAAAQPPILVAGAGARRGAAIPGHHTWIVGLAGGALDRHCRMPAAEVSYDFCLLALFSWCYRLL